MLYNLTQHFPVKIHKNVVQTTYKQQVHPLRAHMNIRTGACGEAVHHPDGNPFSIQPLVIWESLDNDCMLHHYTSILIL